jgi:osmotically-inducible protein OsmY
MMLKTDVQLHQDVMVDDGWITLSGELEWEFQHATAAPTVRYLSGVRGVSNQLAIKPRATANVVKSDIKTALKRVFIKDVKNITVTVKGSEVRLGERFHSWSERENANQAAWRTLGLRTVVNNIPSRIKWQAVWMNYHDK